MIAKEARELALQNIPNKQEMEHVFSKIAEEAKKGLFRTYFTDLSPMSTEELKKMGYYVTSFSSRNETTFTVAWYEVSVKD